MGFKKDPSKTLASKIYIWEEKENVSGWPLKKKIPSSLVNPVPNYFYAQPQILNYLKCVLGRNQTLRCENDLFIPRFLSFASNGNLLYYTHNFNVHILKGEARHSNLWLLWQSYGLIRAAASSLIIFVGNSSNGQIGYNW